MNQKDSRSIVEMITSLATRIRKLEARPYSQSREDVASAAATAASGMSPSTVDYSGITVNTTLVYAGTTTLNDNYEVVLCNAYGGPITINLPASALNVGRFYTIKKIDTSAFMVTVDGYGAETIDDALVKILNTPYLSIDIVCNGARWYVI